MTEYAGIETTPEQFDMPGCELHLNCGTRVAHTEPLSEVALKAREEGQLQANRARAAALAREMALARLQRAARGSARVLTTADLSDVLEALGEL